MSKLSVLTTIGTLIIGVKIASAATVVGFEEFAFPGGNPLALNFINATYQGLNWTGFGSVSGAGWVVSPNDATGWYGGTLQPYAHTGNNFAWNNSGSDLAIVVNGGGTFDLDSFWIRSWPSATFNPTAHAYRDGVEVYTMSFSTTEIYSQVFPNLTNIDRFTITLASPRSLLFDDFTISNVVAVPEANGLATMTLGLLALALLSRRRIM